MSEVRAHYPTNLIVDVPLELHPCDGLEEVEEFVAEDGRQGVVGGPEQLRQGGWPHMREMVVEHLEKH